ncbi:response regulator transcription factor [Solirubrobacter taibaiensis]|nr:response regulator transcription factor [Solirubrobacter taibaiensis]
MGDTLRVLIADDHPLFLFAVAHSVNSRPELELVGQARTGREAIATALETNPDLAVLDVEMPDLDGLEVLRAMNRKGLSTRVLFVSGSLDATKSYNLIEAGAAGVLEKDAMPDEIGDALVRISQGETVLAPSVQAALMREVRDRGNRTQTVLSPREAEVLAFLADGLSAPQIAAELHLSPSTIKTHLQRLYERLEVNDRAAAVAEGMRRGLIE